MAGEIFGQEGIDAVFDIMEVLWDVYKYVEPELLGGPIIVVRPIGDVSPLSGQVHEVLTDCALLSGRVPTGFVIEVGKARRLLVAQPGAIDIPRLPENAVVYEFRGLTERFMAGTRSQEVIKIDALAASQFSIPTFPNLRAALQHYDLEFVRYSSCPILSEAWTNNHRLFLKLKPEEKMRNSLTWFLKIRLGGDYEVRPEQNMDESHPVDIKVTQSLSNRLAIIEIKWLGDSCDNSGAITVRYRDHRVREGAKQLAGYLEMNKQQAPLRITRGYYVIIDARRQGLKPGTTSITRADGLHYKNVEISFDIRYEEVRDDFEKPFRMFAEPQCTDDLPC